MAGIRILEGNPENLRELFQFSSRSFAAHLNIPSTDGVPSTDEAPFSFDAWEARYSQAGLIVYANGDSIAGFAFAHAKSVDHLHIWLALTNPSFQRQGIMRRIFTEIIETAKARDGVTCTVDFDCNHGQCASFYQTTSFCVCDKNWKTNNGSPCSYEQISNLVAFLVSLFVGELGDIIGGVDWFVVAKGNAGYIVAGVFKLLTGGGCGIWWLVDRIRILTGSFPDGNGVPIGDW
ncbi:hypothetical protein BJ742DRAFT_848017 [Cladochytrium replicatum]|nr:hypothetical protein BJ742DRAFT_848017 [Cladochytrium replicatum]